MHITWGQILAVSTARKNGKTKGCKGKMATSLQFLGSWLHNFIQNVFRETDLRILKKNIVGKTSSSRKKKLREKERTILEKISDDKRKKCL